MKVVKHLSGLLSSPYAPFYVFLLAFFVFTTDTKPFFDDLTLAAWKDVPELFQAMGNLLNSWSARVVIDSTMVIVLGTGFHLWQVLNIVMVGILLWSLSSLFLTRPTRLGSLGVLAILLTYPYHDLSSAGWATTTMVYLWPVCLGTFALTTLKQVLLGTNISPARSILSSLAMIYAANLELLLIGLLPLYSMFACLAWKKRQGTRFLAVQVAILLANISLVLFTPGNYARMASEIVLRFPDFGLLSVIDRLQIGYSATLFPFVGQFNPTWFVFSVLLAVAVFRSTGSLVGRIMAILPLAAAVIPWQSPIFQGPSWYGILDIDRALSGGARLEFFLLGVIYLCGMFSCLEAFQQRSGGWLAFYALGAGFVTRMVMSFSPTLWASGERTFIIMYFGIICATLMLFKELMSSGFSLYAGKAPRVGEAGLPV